MAAHDSVALGTLDRYKTPSGRHIEVIDGAESVVDQSVDKGFRGHITAYFEKWTGGLDKHLDIPAAQEFAFAWIGAFIAILLISIADYFGLHERGFPVLIGSFGASAVLLFGVPDSKLAQPRNFVGGHLVSALVGICIRLAVGRVIWLSSALGMSLALVAQIATRTTHPPGGATALIVASNAILPEWQGFQYLVAVAMDCAIMLSVAMLVNNLDPKRRYPTFWW